MPENNTLPLKNVCIKVANDGERQVALRFYEEATKHPVHAESTKDGMYVGVTRIGYTNKIEDTVCASNYVASGETVIPFSEIEKKLVHNRRRKFCLQIAQKGVNSGKLESAPAAVPA